MLVKTGKCVTKSVTVWFGFGDWVHAFIFHSFIHQGLRQYAGHLENNKGKANSTGTLVITGKTTVD